MTLTIITKGTHGYTPHATHGSTHKQCLPIWGQMCMVLRIVYYIYMISTAINPQTRVQIPQRPGCDQGSNPINAIYKNWQQFKSK